MVFVPKLSPSLLKVREIVKPCPNTNFKDLKCSSFWNYVHVTFISYQLVSLMLNNFINFKKFIQQNNHLYLPEVHIWDWYLTIQVKNSSTLQRLCLIYFYKIKVLCFCKLLEVFLNFTFYHKFALRFFLQKLLFVKETIYYIIRSLVFQKANKMC